MKKIQFAMAALLIAAAFSSCKKDDDKNNNNPALPHSLGYNGTDDLSTIPTAISFTGAGNLPANYSIVDKFPPIGDQGQYGTCVAWSTAYNGKTTLEGEDYGWTQTELSNPGHQLSARDLFTNIPDAAKGPNCDGTNFSDALNVILQRGVATLNTAPYTGLGDCSKASAQASWNADAANHKIKDFRKIDKTVESIKSNIAQNIPVMFAAKLADNFMSWNSDAVLSSNTTYDQVGIHAGHALCVAGYDDSRGANGAFRVVNSWSPNWGDAGYIWIDYNFFVNEFVPESDVFIATNDKGNNPPPPVDPTVTGSVDVASWAFSDISLGNTDREIEYNIYNIGDHTASSSQAWSVYYIFYNAYDANDYGFLFQDDINTSIQAGTYNCNGNNCVVNVDLPSGDDLGDVLFGTQQIVQDYTVPNNVTGQYYLLIIADALNGINEPDEQNNYFYTTSQYPVTFINGVVLRSGVNHTTAPFLGNVKFKNDLAPSRSTLKVNPYQTAVNSNFPNAYHMDEIQQMIKNNRKSGDWDRKLNAFKAMHKGGSGMRAK